VPRPPPARLWLAPTTAIVVIFLFIPWLAWLSLPATIVALAGAWLISICCSGSDRRVSDVLEFRPLRSVGRMSYGLYLWHFPIFMALWERGYSKDGGKTAAVALVLTVCCAGLSFHFVERPAQRLKQRLSSRLVPHRHRPRAELQPAHEPQVDTVR
jgi:peptidoglycan/LPS O-acetylase OafA/YrhL